MPQIRLTREFSFEMAHALWNYDGPCRNIHGHSYKLFVTIIGNPIQEPGDPHNGMIIDFSVLKDIVKTHIINYFDHSLVVYKGSPDHFMRNVEQMFEKFYKLDYQPTCENLITDMAEKITIHLPHNVRLHSLKLYETASSYAEWFASDNS